MCRTFALPALCVPLVMGPATGSDTARAGDEAEDSSLLNRRLALRAASAHIAVGGDQPISPCSACSAAIAASGAVSVRRMRGPQCTVT